MYVDVTPISKWNAVILTIKLILHFSNFCCFPQGLCSHTFGCVFSELLVLNANHLAPWPILLAFQIMDRVAAEL